MSDCQDRVMIEKEKHNLSLTQVWIEIPVYNAPILLALLSNTVIVNHNKWC